MDIIIFSIKNQSVYSSVSKYSIIHFYCKRFTEDTGIDTANYKIITSTDKPINNVDGIIYIF